MTWILQEILLAKQPLIFCGEKKVSWQPWAILLDTLKSPNSLIRDWALSTHRSPAISICQQQFAPIDGDPLVNLFQLVSRFRKSDCANLYVPDRVAVRYGMAAQTIDTMSSRCDNWFYNTDVPQFEICHAKMAEEENVEVSMMVKQLSLFLGRLKKSGMEKIKCWYY